MNLKKYIEELKRRNVFKVAITYGITAWILLQIVETVAPIINAPDWLLKVVFVLLIIGLPIALISAWAFEMSPKGIIRTESVDAKENPFSPKKKKPFTSKLLIGALIIVVIGQFVYNQFWPNLETGLGGSTFF
jgi:adenylate cyclase